MSSVEFNYLGNSGLKVANICLGTMTFGEHPVRILYILLSDYSANGICYKNHTLKSTDSKFTCKKVK